MGNRPAPTIGSEFSNRPRALRWTLALAAIVLLAILAAWLSPRGLHWWQEVNATHLDTGAIRAASAAGDNQVYLELKDQIATVPQARVADDSRQAVADALSLHVAVVVDDDPGGGADTASWKQNLFSIAELHQDGTVDQGRFRQTTVAVDRWVVGTMSKPEYANPSSATSRRAAVHVGQVFGLAVQPDLAAIKAHSGIQSAGEEKRRDEKQIMVLILAGAITDDPSILPLVVQDEIAKSSSMSVALETLQQEDLRHPTSVLGRHLAAAVDRFLAGQGEDPMSDGERLVMHFNANGAAASLYDYLDASGNG